MKKFTIICMVAAATFMMSSCGNKAKKAVEAEVVETEVVAEEVPATEVVEGEVVVEEVPAEATADVQ